MAGTSCGAELEQPPFDPSFLEHPGFQIFEPGVREHLARERRVPEPREFRSLVPSAREPWFRFEPQDAAGVQRAGGFDRFIAEHSSIPTRTGSFHDLFGGLIWLHFPRLKTAIHRVQLTAAGAVRTAREHAATHFDESGVIVVSSEPRVFRGLAELDWPGVFWERRDELLTSTQFLAFGHGRLDALRTPHPKLMGMALFVHVRPALLKLVAPELRALLDEELAQELPIFLTEPGRLQPLPVLGVPGWAPAQSVEFYRNEGYFRRARQRLRVRPKSVFIELNRSSGALPCSPRRTSATSLGARRRRIACTPRSRPTPGARRKIRRVWGSFGPRIQFRRRGAGVRR